MPVADDYLFLSRLASSQAVDLLGPMGAAHYWRPVSRQLYYLLVGPWLVHAPWVATLLAALLLLGLYALLYRLARRSFPPPLAAAIACFPLLSEPARVLLAWPSAAQHLLGACFAALAIERAVRAPPRSAGTRGPGAGLLVSCAAALLAMLCNEAAFVVLPALPLVAWLRFRSGRELLRWSAGTVVVVALWGAGYLAALGRGMALPEGAAMEAPWAGYLTVAAQALASQLGYEGLPPPLRGPYFVLAGLLVLAAIPLSFLASARRRIARAAPALLGGLAWFAAGVAPLVFLLPDWNAWRATVAAIGLAFALMGWLALAAPALGAALVAVRVAALLFATPGPATVVDSPPQTSSSFSLARLVRLQRAVESTRRALAPEISSLPRGAIVRYWQMPLLAEVGFNGHNALRAWAHDTTLTWESFGGAEGIHARTDALIEYERDASWPAVRIEPEALRLYRAAFDAVMAGHVRAGDSLLARARDTQGPEARRFHGVLAGNQAVLAWRLEDHARAESFNHEALELMGESATYWALAARLALHRGDRPAAEDAVRRCLTLAPSDPDGLRLARTLGMEPAPR
jgi:hypothetical protein